MEAPGHRAEASVACDAPVETRFKLGLRRMLTRAAISVLVKHLYIDIRVLKAHQNLLLKIVVRRVGRSPRTLRSLALRELTSFSFISY